MPRAPTRIPEPPADLARLPLPLLSLPGGSRWHRVHGPRGRELRFGDEPLNRFNAPDGAFGVCYFARQAAGALGESLMQVIGSDALGNALAIGLLARRRLLRVRVDRPLRLVRCFGRHLAAFGADHRVLHGDHALARRWSRALWAHPDRPDGLLYAARCEPALTCLALYDRAHLAGRVRVVARRRLDAAGALLAAFCARFGMGIDLA